MTGNVTLMRDAKASLRGKWGGAALTTLVLVVLLGAVSFTGIGTILLSGPLALGYIIYLKAVKAGESPRLETLFRGFDDFLRSMLAWLLVCIFVWLWSLLLIIPGIVMAIAWSMTMFIIADDPEISSMDALRRSRDMMRGYKWKYFCLLLRFLGWLILCCMTAGILSFWIKPYMRMSALNFYEDVKADWIERGGKA